jgi:hypothetical protein
MTKLQGVLSFFLILIYTYGYKIVLRPKIFPIFFAKQKIFCSAYKSFLLNLTFYAK